MADRTALVVGATGMAGRALIFHLAEQAGWDVIALSRREPDFATSARHVALDVSDVAACHEAAAQFRDVTHVFYTAYVDAPGWVAQRAPNAALLENIVNALEPAATRLEHVCLLQGTKYYGHHLGPYKTPAREDDPRHMPPNFYFDQQDFLAARSAGKRWNFSCARPHAICGVAHGNPLNLIAVLGAYATVSCALALPLRYPASERAFRVIRQVTDAGLLARAMVWMATTPACAGEAFNVTNTDVFRYENCWPVLADYFGLKPAAPQAIDLTLFMSDKAALWQDIARRHGLIEPDLARVADWRFANYTFGSDWDQMSDTNKLRKYGFFHSIDTEASFITHLDACKDAGLLP